MNSRTPMKVTFSDGREETVQLTAKLEVEIERKFELSLEECTRREHTYYGVWLALGAAKKERGRSFEDFLDMVDSVELAEDRPVLEVVTPDPTQPPATSGSSSS
ncbi:hypothetical protein [Tenggerimyces flavus]|uniref:Uncharacterized protein n=1 Tax=Tenggerimyces flavus TaxID=1708749 RepID=A0ABV7YBI1_9ACTN|nr:hypothetical protein [Tenggerimyces flavus]MBM7788850.1 hypothetical protein [Tenggerimyces flavus]